MTISDRLNLTAHVICILLLSVVVIHIVEDRAMISSDQLDYMMHVYHMDVEGAMNSKLVELEKLKASGDITNEQAAWCEAVYTGKIEEH